MNEPAVCSSCGAAIRWARSAVGVPAPYNFEPDAKGLWEIDSRGVSFFIRKGGTPAARYTSHLTTCQTRRQPRRPTACACDMGNDATICGRIDGCECGHEDTCHARLERQREKAS